jgi:hypothetical protein
MGWCHTAGTGGIGAPQNSTGAGDTLSRAPPVRVDGEAPDLVVARNCSAAATWRWQTSASRTALALKTDAGQFSTHRERESAVRGDRAVVPAGVEHPEV